MGPHERWIDFLQKTATGTRRTRSLLTLVGALVFFGFTTLFVLAGIFVDGVLHLPRLLPGGARLIVSIPFMASGVILAGWSVFHFLKVKGTPVPLNPPPKLVDTGPYPNFGNFGDTLLNLTVVLFSLDLSIRHGRLAGVRLFLLDYPVAFWTCLALALGCWTGYVLVRRHLRTRAF